MGFLLTRVTIAEPISWLKGTAVMSGHRGFGFGLLQVFLLLLVSIFESSCTIYVCN